MNSIRNTSLSSLVQYEFLDFCFSLENGQSYFETCMYIKKNKHFMSPSSPLNPTIYLRTGRPRRRERAPIKIDDAKSPPLSLSTNLCASFAYKRDANIENLFETRCLYDRARNERHRYRTDFRIFFFYTP